MIGGSHYDTLGIPPNATSAEIRQAFAERSATYDLAPRASLAQRHQAKKALVALQSAYEVLVDPRRRGEYDWRLGIDDLQPLDWGGALPAGG
jgi:DnaJ-class molecular chaperone